MLLSSHLAKFHPGYGVMHGHAANRTGSPAHLAGADAQAFAGTTSGAGIWTAVQSLEAASFNRRSSALSGLEVYCLRSSNFTFRIGYCFQSL